MIMLSRYTLQRRVVVILMVQAFFLPRISAFAPSFRRSPITDKAHGFPSSRSDYTSEEPMTTRHLRLGQVFSKTRDYIFKITKNVRFYEWTKDEVETLFTDLVESMEESAVRSIHEKPIPSPGMGATYELNQVIVLRDSSTLNDDFWEVADGQQRLISLCLLYAALRDTVSDDPQHPLVREIQEVLLVQAYRKEDCPRVTLREKHNGVLHKVLRGDKIKKTAKDRNKIQQRMAENYFYLRTLLEDCCSRETSDFLDEFYTYLTESVYIYLTIPENQSVARKLVGVSRRGKDTEPIDEFKSLVVFLGISDEALQDQYMEKWVSLEDLAGRKTFEDACLLIAQADLGRRAQRDAQIDLLEDLWKQSSSEGKDGVDFFEEKISHGVMQLYHFREGTLPFASNRKDRQTNAMLMFLRDVAGIPSAKTIEIALLSCLRYIDPSRNPDYLSHCLTTLERVGLLFLATDVKIRARHERVFGIAHAIRNSLYLDRYDLTSDEANQILVSLDKTAWGSTGPKRKCAAAVLGRIDAAIALEQSEAIIEGSFSVEHVLPQTPDSESRWIVDWSTEDRRRWTHRLGNMCILNKRKNSAAKNHDFLQKRPLYAKTVFPITNEIGKFKKWTPVEVKKHHQWIMKLCRLHFDLEGNNSPGDSQQPSRFPDSSFQ